MGHNWNLNTSKVDWDINVLFSQDENLGYWCSTGFGFKSLSSFTLEWCDFRKNGLTENFCHKKESWKPLKTTQFCWLAVTKPFEQNLIMRHQWKEDIHIFHLIPCDTKYLYYSGQTDHFYNQRAKEIGSDMSISSEVPVQATRQPTYCVYQFR